MGGDYQVMRVEPSRTGLVRRDPEELFTQFYPVRIQDKSATRKRALTLPRWHPDLQPPKLGELNLCCSYITQSMVLCYSNPNK